LFFILLFCIFLFGSSVWFLCVNCCDLLNHLTNLDAGTLVGTTMHYVILVPWPQRKEDFWVEPPAVHAVADCCCHLANISKSDSAFFQITLELVFVMLQLPQELMSQPEKSDNKPSDKKQKGRSRHLSGGEELLRGFLMVHESCADIGNMATPRRFMAFLHCYRQLYKLKKEGIENKQQHLQVGCKKHLLHVLRFCITFH